MKFEIKSRFDGSVIFTAEIDCAKNDSYAVKLGLAVRAAVKVGASLNGAILNGAILDGAILDGAILNGASLYGAILNGASLYRASLDGAILNGASLYRASLDGAILDGAILNGASLNGASGINDWIKCAQIDEWPITYTSEIMQIGCEKHKISEWAEFDDKRILEMDGKRALKFWRKYKDWIFQTIELCPAKPTMENTDEE